MNVKFEHMHTEVAPAQVTGNSCYGYWIYRGIMVSYKIIINDVEMYLTYSNGGYDYNDVDCMSNWLEIDQDLDNTDAFLRKLESMYEAEVFDIYNSDSDDSHELLELLRDRNLELSNIELCDLYTKIFDNCPHYLDYMQEEGIFVIENITEDSGSLKVTCSHDVVVYIEADSADEFFEQIDEISQGYQDNKNIEYYEFFSYMFDIDKNIEIVNEFFSNFDVNNSPKKLKG